MAIVISNEKDLERKIKEIVSQGKEKFHVIADFDRTLTKAFVNGQKSPTVIAQIRNGDYLTPDYSSRAYKLYDIYHPIEVSAEISRDEKNRKMQEWWRKHFDLLVECGLNKEVMQRIVSKRTLQFRMGALEWIDFLHENDIPLIIMSAGPGDMIAEYLRQEGRLYENVHIVANMFEFDDKGIVRGVKKPIIHSLNKHEIELKGLPIHKQLKKRKNVLLLGDGIEDLGMVEGFSYENLVSIGFLNEEPEKNLESFKQSYDVVLLGDGDMGYVNEITRRIITG